VATACTHGKRTQHGSTRRTDPGRGDPWARGHQCVTPLAGRRARVPQLPPLAGAAVAPVFHAADDHPDTIRKGLPLALRRPNHRAPVWISRRATLLPKVVLGVRFRRRNRDRQFANLDCRLTCRHQDSRIAPGSCQWLSLDRKPQEMRSQNTCIKTLPPLSSHESIMRVGGVREDGERFNISRHQCAEDI